MERIIGCLERSRVRTLDAVIPVHTHYDLAAQALLDTLSRDDPPFRLLLGNIAYDVAVDRYETRLTEFRAGEQVARAADDR